MRKRTPLECTLENCGDLYAKCGKRSTYARCGCRCDNCYAVEIARQDEWRQENAQRISDRNRAYRQANRDAIAEKDRRYYIENQERLKDAARAYYAANRERATEVALEWARDNPEKKRATARKGQQVRRARRAANLLIPFTGRQWLQKVEYWGGHCYLQLDGCTGGADTMEHVKPVSAGGGTLLANLRPACQPCNARKGSKWPFTSGHEMARS